RRLVAGEPAAGLTLGESHGPTGSAEVGVAGLVEKGGQLLQLPERCGWSCWLPEGHGRSLAQSPLRRPPGRSRLSANVAHHKERIPPCPGSRSMSWTRSRR